MESVLEMSARDEARVIRHAREAHRAHWGVAAHTAITPEQRAYANIRYEEIMSVLRARRAE